MHVLIAFLVGLAVWLAAVFFNPDPFMILVAPLVISAVTLICCLMPTRKRRPAFEPGILGSSLER